MNTEEIEKYIRTIPDFPKKGIQFKDISPLLASKDGFQKTIDLFAKKLDDQNIQFICGIESRGFIFAAALAEKLNIGFIPIRKPGKLPAKTFQVEYELEYGSDTLEIHQDAFIINSSLNNQIINVALIDDLLATGGTASAAIELIQKCDVNIKSILFLIELDFLKGRDKILIHDNIDLISLIHY